MKSLKDKKVFFISTKNVDYIRNTQEIQLLKKKAKSVDVIAYKDKSYGKRLIKLYSKLLFTNTKKYDVVFIGFAPQLVLPFFNFKFKKNYVIIDFFISVYDTMVDDRKKFKEGGICAKFAKWLDRACLTSAKKVICDTDAHGDYFAEEFKVDRKGINTLYLKADNDIYYPRPQDKSGLEDKFVVLYFGSVLPLQGVETIMKAMDILKDKEELYFYFIGPVGNDVKKTEAPNIEYINWLSQEDLAEYISKADLCLAGHFNGNIGKAVRTIPGKAYIYENMNKKMILGDNKANRELFKEDDKHFFVKMSDGEALAEKILDVKSRK